MKIIALIIFLFTMATTGYQQDVIELKDGKKVEVTIKSHDTKQIVTNKGKFEYSKIKMVKFFVKNYDDVKFYELLEKQGVEVRFATVPH